MISSKAFRQLAYSVTLPTLAAVSPKLTKETVYMPSRVAALVLGEGDATSAAPLPPTAALPDLPTPDR
jgi:hypothetical protein